MCLVEALGTIGNVYSSGEGECRIIQVMLCVFDEPLDSRGWYTVAEKKWAQCRK